MIFPKLQWVTQKTRRGEEQKIIHIFKLHVIIRARNQPKLQVEGFQSLLLTRGPAQYTYQPQCHMHNIQCTVHSAHISHSVTMQNAQYTLHSTQYTYWARCHQENMIKNPMSCTTRASENVNTLEAVKNWIVLLLLLLLLFWMLSLQEHGSEAVLLVYY